MSVRNKREQSDCFHCSATTLSVFPLRKASLCFLSDASVRKKVPVRHEHKGIDIDEVRTVQNRPTIIEINNNLPPDFLLGHPGKPIPEPYPGSGVALRQTIIWRYSSGRAMRTPTVTYIRTDIIIYRLPDTGKPLLRTTASRYRSVNPRPLLISNL